MSRHILRNVARALLLPRPVGVGWPTEAVQRYIDVLVGIVRRSGGEILGPQTGTVGDCADFEDNRILELAIAGQPI